MKLRGLVPNFYIYASVSDLYIPTIGPPIFCRKNRRTDRGTIRVNNSQKHECGNWAWGPAVSFLGIFVSNFGSVSLRCGLTLIKKGAAWLSRVRHGSVRVRHGSVSSVSGGCKAAPSSNLGSAPQWRPSTWACSDEETGAEVSECYEWMSMNECVWMYSK
jgi:hypothetical protein